MASAELSRRVGRVVGYPPLVDLTAEQRGELRDEVVATAQGRRVRAMEVFG
jgi:hypothetical protein